MHVPGHGARLVAGRCPERADPVKEVHDEGQPQQVREPEGREDRPVAVQRGREAGQPREAVEAQRLEHQRQHAQEAQQEESRRRHQGVLHEALHGVHLHHVRLVVPVAVVLLLAAAALEGLLGLRDGAEGLRPRRLRRPQQPRRFRGRGHAAAHHHCSTTSSPRRHAALPAWCYTMSTRLGPLYLSC